MTFLEFLDSISGAKSPLKKLIPYTLDLTYKNVMYQQILEMLFGPEGTEVANITENQVLSYGERSFYLKLAIFATPIQCAIFLDYIYAAIVAKRPGHYWNLLLTVKKINDHCNDTLIREPGATFASPGTPCNQLLFTNTGDANKDLLPVAAVGQAIKNLIKVHIERMGAYGRGTTSPEVYLGDQIDLCRELQNYTPNPLWRMKVLDVTLTQMKATGSEELHTAYNQYNDQLLARLNETMAEHQRTCNNPMCTLRVTREFKEKEEEYISKCQVEALKADDKRYTEELALMSGRLGYKFKLWL